MDYQDVILTVFAVIVIVLSLVIIGMSAAAGADPYPVGTTPTPTASAVPLVPPPTWTPAPKIWLPRVRRSATDRTDRSADRVQAIGDQRSNYKTIGVSLYG